nr:hypothetical protein [Tanacetum cinerariifolium]
LSFAIGENLVTPYLGIFVIAPAYPALWWCRSEVAVQRKRVQIWDKLISPLDDITNQWRCLWIHPRLDNVPDEVVVRGSLEAVDGEA